METPYDDEIADIESTYPLVGDFVSSGLAERLYDLLVKAEAYRQEGQQDD